MGLAIARRRRAKTPVRLNPSCARLLTRFHKSLTWRNAIRRSAPAGLPPRGFFVVARRGRRRGPPSALVLGNRSPDERSEIRGVLHRTSLPHFASLNLSAEARLRAKADAGYLLFKPPWSRSMPFERDDGEPRNGSAQLLGPPAPSSKVCHRGQAGKHLLSSRLTGFDPMQSPTALANWRRVVSGWPTP